MCQHATWKLKAAPGWNQALLSPLPSPLGREKQAALAAEEARRKAAMAARAQKFRADVAGQLAEKEAAKLAELEGRRRELEAAMAELEVGAGLGWAGAA